MARYCDSETCKKWKKVLYEDQNVPDNYVDESFLTEMRKNIYVRSYKYWDLVQQTTIIVQQLCVVAFLIVSWWALDEAFITPTSILYLLFPLSVAGFGAHIVLTTREGSRSSGLIASTKTAVVILCLTDFLSPILKTLTHTISTDTIYAMSVFMIIGHLLFHDYRLGDAPISRAVSLNMSFFSSVCLASRLQSSEHVFSFIIFALLLFGFWPMLQRSLRRHMPWLMTPLTILLCLISFSLLTFVHIAAGILFLVLVCFISFICPRYLLSLQLHKNNIYGPWDEAVISPNINCMNSKE